MDRKNISALCGILCLTFLLFGCAAKGPAVVTHARNTLPPVILWAWERPEDLTFLDPERVGVAFLAQTLLLQNEDVVFRPRLQPLRVSPKTKLIAVTRIESTKTTGERAALSECTGGEADFTRLKDSATRKRFRNPNRFRRHPIRTRVLPATPGEIAAKIAGQCAAINDRSCIILCWRSLVAGPSG